MSSKFVVEGGLKVGSGQNFELSGTDVDRISTSTSLAGASPATALVTEYAVKSYVDSQLGASDIDLALNGVTQTSIDQSTGKLGLSAVSSEIEITYAHDGTDGTFTIGLPDDVTIGQHLTVTGDSTMNGSVTLGDAAADDITFTGSAASNLVPKADSTYELGSSTALWSNIYADSLVGNATEMIISADGSEASLSSNANDTLSINASAGAWFSGDINVAGSLKGSENYMVISADGDETDVAGSANDSLSLNAAGGIFTDDAVDMDSTLNVEGVVTMQAGYETDYLKKDEFAVTGSGISTTAFTFDDSTYKGAKIVLTAVNGTDMTSKEILLVSNGSNVSLVEYGTVSVGTEVSQTWSATSSSGTCTVAVAFTGDIKGSFELIK